jgi:glycosyltransferase involved in cell wall biosynthesis
VPYLIAPHTALAPWALGQKRLKKRLARVLVWNRLFAAAAGFHALNKFEAEEIRNIGRQPNPPIFVVPNGVSLAEFARPDSINPLAMPDEALEWRLEGKPFVLFLARLHLMKGPDVLLEAFALVARELGELKLVFAGPDFGMLETLTRRTTELGLSGRVNYLGLVSGAAKLWLLKNAVCLCQPSRSEGFSLSILEAMASGRPVVISDRCKFPEVMEFAAGIVVPMTANDIATGLKIYASDPVRRMADGRAARELIERCYTWNIVAEQADQMYAQTVARKFGAGMKAEQRL